MPEPIFQYLQIADTRFAFDPSSPHLDFTKRIADTYEASHYDSMFVDTVELSIEELSAFPEASDEDKEMFFHRSSNYEHWNIAGLKTPRGIFLQDYGVEFDVDTSGKLFIRCTRPVHSRVPELIFHAMRNIALYGRAFSKGPMLHASAVVLDGAGILFAGQKGSGKSTLFMDAISSGSALPLSNDRCLLDLHGVRPIVRSWPSYLSYCEGTICDYPDLQTAFMKYEDDPNADGRKWGTDFEGSYEQNRKRIIPPFYFLESKDHTYLAEAELGCIVRPVVQLDACLTARIFAVKDSATLELSDIAEMAFPIPDPDIICWHDYSIERHSLEKDLIRLRECHVPVIDLEFNPITGKPVLREIIKNIRKENLADVI